MLQCLNERPQEARERFAVGFGERVKFAEKLLHGAFSRRSCGGALCVGKLSNVVKAYVVVSGKRYGSLERYFAAALFVYGIVLIGCAEILRDFALGLVAVLTKLAYSLIISHEISFLSAGSGLSVGKSITYFISMT